MIIITYSNYRVDKNHYILQHCVNEKNKTNMCVHKRKSFCTEHFDEESIFCDVNNFSFKWMKVIEVFEISTLRD